MDYEQKYKEALEKAQKELQTCGSKDCNAARQIYRFFPELSESEDEKVKRIIHSISNKISFHLHDIFTEEEFQCFDAWSNAWLEKQGEPKQEENDQKSEPFRIKKGKWYVCIHDFCHNGIRIGEIIQAEHDNTIRGIGFLYMENKYFRPAFENEIPQKSKWSSIL